MTIQRQLLYTIQMVAILLFVACSQDEFDASPVKSQHFTISVIDRGYAPNTGGNMTRAIENGYVTEFTEGDTCGLFVVRNDRMIYSNVKLTAKKNAVTDKLVWDPISDTTLTAGLGGESYYLYYPYKADLDNTTINEMLKSEDDFYKPLVESWQPNEDQSTYAAYTASDLMTGTCTPTYGEGFVKLSFVMTHRMALSVIEMPKTVYKFTDANVPDYSVLSETTFTGTARPLCMDDCTFRFLINPNDKTSPKKIEGNYDNGSKEFAITPSSEVQLYKKYKVDGGVTVKNITYAESGFVRIGDFYCTKDNGKIGYLIPKEADQATVQAANVVGIVFQTDKNRIGQAEKNVLGGDNKVHGLVMSVKNAATSQEWSTYYNSKDNGLPNCSTKADNYKDISGYGNCEHIRTNRGNFDNYPAFKAAYDYNTSCPVPTTTTGWYLPSSGQWWDIMQNLGGCPWLASSYEQESTYPYGDFKWTNQGNVPVTLNAWMSKIATGSKDEFGNNSFWSSSEFFFHYSLARIWNIFFNGEVKCYFNNKWEGVGDVRPVLAF